jgi:RNA polymerase sigma-70 factor (ECF subfamily)
MHDPTLPLAGGPAGPEDERTLDLLRRARAGDRRALEVVLGRCLPRMRRWASGRLPRWARDVVDTDDMIQDALIRTCERIEQFEPRGDGALQAYLCQALKNRIADELRKAGRRPATGQIPEGQPAQDASPLEATIGREALAAYEKALAALGEQEREAVIARVELGLGYDEIAAAFGKPSRDAARMSVSRALLRLAEEMGRGQA